MSRPARARFRLAGAALALLAALASTATAAAPPADAGINRPFANPEFARWVRVFERPGREVYDRREAIVAASGLRPGMVVADIGAGTGLFTRLFAPRVEPAGRVIAVDISQVFVENILRLAREQGLANVEGVVDTATDVGLAAGSVDLAFLCNTYHHFEQPGPMLHSIRRALRPGGTLVVIDFRRQEGVSSPWVMGHVHAGKPAVIRELEAAGFRLLEDLPLLEENYFLRFARE